MDRRRFLQVSASVVAAAALGGCTNKKTGEKVRATDVNVPAERPILRLSGGLDAGFPSPFSYILGPGYGTMITMFDTLMLVDSTAELIPWLAESYERSPDGTVYTFRLRDNVRWQDGKPMTADDVAFTFDYHAAQKKKGTLAPRLIFQPEHIAAVTARDPHTVEIRLDRPAVTFLRGTAAGFPIVPRHIWSSIEDSSKVQDPAVLVGTGPYRLVDYKAGTGNFQFRANDDFFLGKPFVKGMDMVPVGDEIAALLAGDISAGSPSFVGANASILDRFRKDDAFGVIEGPADSFLTALYFNPAKGGALADPVFRRACARALDRKDFVERILGGRGDPGNPGFLPKTHPYHVDVEQYPYDREAADKMLEDAGYRRRGKDVRVGPDGKPLSFKLLASPFSEATVELVVARLREVGIRLEIEPVEEFAPYLRIPEGDFEMVVIIYGGHGGDPDFMRKVYDTNGGLPFSAHGYSNPEFNALADEQLVTLDEEKRKKLVARMQEIAARDIPFFHLYYPQSILVYRKAVFDQYTLEPGGGGGFNKQTLVTGRAGPGTKIRPIKE